MLLWGRKKKKKGKNVQFLLSCCSIWNILDLRTIPQDTGEKQVLSIFKSTQNVFMLSTYSSQEAAAPRQPLTTWNTLGCDYLHSSHTGTLPHTGKRLSHGGGRSQNADFLSWPDIIGGLFAIGNLPA